MIKQDYPKTLYSSKGILVVNDKVEEENAKKKGFKANYRHQDYPQMLYKGKVTNSGTEQKKGSFMVVESPEEEAQAKLDGFKPAPGEAPAKKTK